MTLVLPVNEVRVRLLKSPMFGGELKFPVRPRRPGANSRRAGE